ncbi:hypothetical protein ScPMuIL_016702 [Solemya velum]
MSRPKTYLNADICLEDNLYQKYKELDTILTGHFVEKTSNLTRSHIHQMEQMRQQYSVVSHGMSPRGVLIPRSLPSHIRNHEKVQLVCGEESECSNLTDRSEDLAFQTICSIMTADNARKQKKIRTDIRADANSEKLERKNEKKKANTKLQRETKKSPVSEKETSQVESPTEIRERWQQQAKDRQNRKPTEPEKQAKPPVKTQVVQSPARTQTPQPPKIEVSQDVKLNDKSLTSPKPKPSAQSPRKAIPAKIHAQNVETVMNNKFETNPFKLPFPPELGVPKYVDDKQKLIFSSHMFDDLDVDKRPEPQGCDANHPPVCNTQAPPANETDTAAPLDDSSCVKSPPSDKTFAEKDAVSSTEKQNDSHGHDVETNDKEAADVNRFDIGHEKHKSGKTSANMGKRVSFSEETTVFEASDSPGSDTSSPREDVQFVEDMKSEDFGRSDSVDIPSGTFLTSLDADN